MATTVKSGHNEGFSNSRVWNVKEFNYEMGACPKAKSNPEHFKAHSCDTTPGIGMDSVIIPFSSEESDRIQ